MGRKAIVDNEPKNHVIPVRLTGGELAEIKTAAESAGKPASTWLRDLGLAAARKSPTSDEIPSAKKTVKPLRSPKS